jgi:hypothetical protein
MMNMNYRAFDNYFLCSKYLYSWLLIFLAVFASGANNPGFKEMQDVEIAASQTSLLAMTVSIAYLTNTNKGDHRKVITIPSQNIRLTQAQTL